ncbi:MAG: DUF2130 domain-containing protein [Deltaproteobacteria bacterium]|nr:DUF2130 domain-containing protein [Deltaproteobacteria bacterium]
MKTVLTKTNLSQRMLKNANGGSSYSTIKCPQCGAEVSVTEALSNEIAEKQERILEERLRTETISIEKRLREKMQKETNVELEDLKAVVLEKDKKIEQVLKSELEFRKRSRELEGREKEMELELERRWEKEKEKLREEAKDKLSEEYRLKSAEKDLQIDGLRQKIEELKRRVEQGSQQAQGEVFQLDLANLLKSKFPTDVITVIEKGKRGADVKQAIEGSTKGECTLLWEAKNTNTWKKKWILKAKTDQRREGVEVVVIVSRVLPKGTRNFGPVDGVWVCSPEAAIPVAMLLRFYLSQMIRMQKSVDGKQDTFERIFKYLCSVQFRQRVETICDAIKAFKELSEREKLAMTRVWAERDKHLDQLLEGTSGLYGDLRGISKGSIASVSQLELPAGPVPRRKT